MCACLDLKPIGVVASGCRMLHFLCIFLFINGGTSYEFDEFYQTVEGDILREKKIPGMESSALARPDLKWQNAEVPYAIHHSVSTQERTKIREAMNEVQQKTCVKFREARENDWARIEIVKGAGCNSFVGRQGGVQRLSLGNNCYHRHIILHELMHALGFVHEHNRADRDKYVEIRFENVKEGERHNFDKRAYEDLTLMDTPYTYNSIMHYHQDAFSKNGQNTIITKQHTDNVGGWDKLSDIDAERIRKLYCGQTGTNFQKGANGIFWSNGCDFYGRDIGRVNTRPEQCGDKCAENQRCTHFTWNKYNGGVCYLKAGIGSNEKPKSADQHFICGYKESGGTIGSSKWNSGKFGIWWSNGCDFYGRDIERIRTKPEFCGDKCAHNDKCTHFTWNPSDGGTCFLKSGFPSDAKPSCSPFVFVCGFDGSVKAGGDFRCT